MLAQFRLKAGEVLRESGGDVKNFFYNITHADGVVAEELRRGWPRSCCPWRRPGDRKHIALRVCVMGDLNSADIAQTVHERVFGGIRGWVQMKWKTGVRLSASVDGSRARCLCGQLVGGAAYDATWLGL